MNKPITLIICTVLFVSLYLNYEYSKTNSSTKKSNSIVQNEIDQNIDGDKNYLLTELNGKTDYFPQVKYFKGSLGKVNTYKVFPILKSGKVLNEEINNNSYLSGIHPIKTRDTAIWLKGIIKKDGILEILKIDEINSGYEIEELKKHISKIKWNPALKNLNPVNCEIEIIGY